LTNTNPKQDISTLSSTIKNKNFKDSNSLKKNYENTSGAYTNYTNNFQLTKEDLDFTSGKKEEKNFTNIGTPMFRLENSAASSRKKNKSGSNKKVELRYFEEDDFTNSINNVKNLENFGNFQIKNNSFIGGINEENALTKNYINTEYNYRARSTSEINQKLNFEVICENYQNGNK